MHRGQTGELRNAERFAPCTGIDPGRAEQPFGLRSRTGPGGQRDRRQGVRSAALTVGAQVFPDALGAPKAGGLALHGTS